MTNSQQRRFEDEIMNDVTGFIREEEDQILETGRFNQNNESKYLMAPSFD